MAEEPILDAQTLDQLRQDIGNDLNILTMLVECYLETTPDLIQSLRSAFDGGDWELVNRSAHSLKSSSATLGAIRLANQCFSLETLSHLSSEFPADAAVLITQIEQEYQQVATALLREIQP